MDLLLSLLFELFWWWFESSLFLHSPASFLAAWFLTLYLLWDRYVFIMAAYRAHKLGRLYGLNKWLAYPSVVIGFLLDILVNICVATFVFRQLPRQWLVTTRLKEYKHDEKHAGKWRQRRADWWCTHVLHPFDEEHCD